MGSLHKDKLIDAMTDNLQMLRIRLGLTQAQLAEMIGIGRHTYMAIENRKSKMPWHLFLSLLMIFTKNKSTDIILSSIGIYTEELNDYLKLKSDKNK